MSEADFERATDVEDENEESSEFIEDEVTDEEAMAIAAQDRGDQDTDDSDLGFYMPTVIAKVSGEKPKKSPQ